MEPRIEWIEKINQIVGQSAEWAVNHKKLAPGDYYKQDGKIYFAYNEETTLSYPEDQLMEQSISFLSFFLQREAKQSVTWLSFFGKLLEGASKGELLLEAQKLDIHLGKVYLPMIVQNEQKNKDWMSIFSTYFSGHFIGASLNDYSYFLIPLEEPLELEGYEIIEEMGRGLRDLFLEEGFDHVWMAITPPVKDLNEWAAAFQEGKQLLASGRRFYPKEHVYFTWSMSLESLLYALPEQKAKEFIKSILGESSTDLFQFELFDTIQMLLQENLNVSEAARKLFIHRNTLLYRMERFKTETGKDLRSAKDVFIVYIAMLLCKGFLAE